MTTKLNKSFESATKAQSTELLDILDPECTGEIDLEELKPLLSKLPSDLRDPVGELLRNYVFEYHSFKIPTDLFTQLYINKFERKDTFASSPSPRKSLGDSFFRSTTSSFWPSRSNTMRDSSTKKKRLRSFSPKKNRTYKEIYNRKKSVEGETWKRSTKLFDRIDSKMQSFSIFENSQSLPVEKSSIHRDYKFKYSNFNELRRIRQKHLELCNRFQN